MVVGGVARGPCGEHARHALPSAFERHSNLLQCAQKLIKINSSAMDVRRPRTNVPGHRLTSS